MVLSILKCHRLLFLLLACYLVLWMRFFVSTWIRAIVAVASGPYNDNEVMMALVQKLQLTAKIKSKIQGNVPDDTATTLVGDERTKYPTVSIETTLNNTKPRPKKSQLERAGNSKMPPEIKAWFQRVIRKPSGKRIAWAPEPFLWTDQSVIMVNSSMKGKIPTFVRQHCNFDGLTEEWMPPASNWKRRAPYFMILGAKKAGTTGLFASLSTYPQVSRSGYEIKEPLFFIPMRFPHWSESMQMNDGSWNISVVGSRVNVAAAREQYRSTFFRTQLLFRNHTYYMAGEATPDYLLYSKYSSQAILCTTPWVKLISILREPIERLFSHYNFIKDPVRQARRHGPSRQQQQLPSFEEWVNDDIELLKDAGVFPKNLSDIPSYMGTVQERQGWHRYQRTIHNRLGDRPVARSLYALQLEDWFEAMEQTGKNISSDFLIVFSDQIKTTISHVVEWLGLPPQGGEENASPRRRHAQVMVTHYSSEPIGPKFLQKLQQLFTPYNRRLYKFLEPRYHGIFDYSSDNQTSR